MGDLQLTCSLCHKGFTRQETLDRHLRSIHNRKTDPGTTKQTDLGTAKQTDTGTVAQTDPGAVSQTDPGTATQIDPDAVRRTDIDTASHEANAGQAMPAGNRSQATTGRKKKAGKGKAPRKKTTAQTQAPMVKEKEVNDKVNTSRTIATAVSGKTITPDNTAAAASNAVVVATAEDGNATIGDRAVEECILADELADDFALVDEMGRRLPNVLQLPDMEYSGEEDEYDPTDMAF